MKRLCLSFTNPAGTVEMCMCVGCGGVSGVGGGLGQDLGRWGGVMSVCVVSPDYLCRWQVQVSGYCARRIHAHLRCTQCSILLHIIDIVQLLTAYFFYPHFRSTYISDPYINSH